jgi:cytochrome c-type biogenesis protein CcmE
MVLAGVAISATLALRAFQENLLYFFSPTQVVDGEAPTERSFRIGGLVLEESVKRQPGSLTVDFVVTDFVNSVPVQYSRCCPICFRKARALSRGEA